jgi:hypothetical protein
MASFGCESNFTITHILLASNFSSQHVITIYKTHNTYITWKWELPQWLPMMLFPHHHITHVPHARHIAWEFSWWVRFTRYISKISFIPIAHIRPRSFLPNQARLRLDWSPIQVIFQAQEKIRILIFLCSVKPTGFQTHWLGTVLDWSQGSKGLEQILRD